MNDLDIYRTLLSLWLCLLSAILTVPTATTVWFIMLNRLAAIRPRQVCLEWSRQSSSHPLSYAKAICVCVLPICLGKAAVVVYIAAVSLLSLFDSRAFVWTQHGFEWNLGYAGERPPLECMGHIRVRGS